MRGERAGMRHRFLLVASFALLVALLSPRDGASQPAPPQPAARPWLLLSDIHFNPFDDPRIVDELVQAPATRWHAILAASSAAPSGYFNDTNFALLSSAIGGMRRYVPDPAVVVIDGDFLAHRFPEQFASAEPTASPGVYDRFVDKTIAFMAWEFDAAYPRAQFAITLGNNDGYCGDYKSTPSSPFLANMASVWRPLVDRGGSAPNFAREFSTGGYFTASSPDKSTTLVALNSVLWSSYYENACGGGGDPGADELDWLTSALSPAPGANRIVLMHIPAGIDEYASLRANKPVPFLQDAYAPRLLGLLTGKNAGTTGIVASHIHHASFAIVQRGDGAGVPALLVPSISPIFANNPAFVAARFDAATGAIADATTYDLPLGTPAAGWKPEYTFSTAYGVGGFDAPSLEKLQANLAADPTLRATFAAYYNSESTVAMISPPTWPWYWCGHVNLDPTGYASCVARLLPPLPKPPGR
jgi:sphingomyelin phosphodiesterase acid-like 3